MPAPYEREEVTIQPASPQPTAPAPITHTAGRGGIPMPVLQAGHGRGAAVAPSPRISGVAPAVQAAGAPGVPPGTTLPVTEVLPPGIQPYQYGGQAVNGQITPGSMQTGYKFLDPNTGREAGFPTLQAAQAALGAAGTPQGVDQAKAGLLERIRQVDGDTSQTNEAENMLLAPAALPPTAVAPPLKAGGSGQNALGSRGFGPNEKIEIIRGVDSQVYNTNPQGLSVDQVIREQLSDSIISNLSGGRSALDASYAVDENGQPHRLQTNFDTLAALEEQDRKAATPSLDTVKAGRAQELTSNPEGINDADRLLFAPKQTQGQKREKHVEPVYDQYGVKIGETPYTYNPYDGAESATPLNLGESQPQPEGRPVDYPDAYQAVKPDGKMGWFVKRKGKTYLVSK